MSKKIQLVFSSSNNWSNIFFKIVILLWKGHLFTNVNSVIKFVMGPFCKLNTFLVGWILLVPTFKLLPNCWVRMAIWKCRVKLLPNCWVLSFKMLNTKWLSSSRCWNEVKQNKKIKFEDDFNTKDTIDMFSINDSLFTWRKLKLLATCLAPGTLHGTVETTSTQEEKKLAKISKIWI